MSPGPYPPTHNDIEYIYIYIGERYMNTNQECCVMFLIYTLYCAHKYTYIADVQIVSISAE